LATDIKVYAGRTKNPPLLILLLEFPELDHANLKGHVMQVTCEIMVNEKAWAVLN